MNQRTPELEFWCCLGSRLVFATHSRGFERWFSDRFYHFESKCFFFLFLLPPPLFPSSPHPLAHSLAHATEERGCWSRSPPRSSDMQPGSQMIKAVAGGLHFETINRPMGAESNSKPSISVRPSSSAAQREGELGGREGGLHLCILSLHGSMPLRGTWSSTGKMARLSDVISSRLCGFIRLTPRSSPMIKSSYGVIIFSPSKSNSQWTIVQMLLLYCL